MRQFTWMSMLISLKVISEKYIGWLLIGSFKLEGTSDGIWKAIPVSLFKTTHFVGHKGG